LKSIKDASAEDPF